MSGAVSTGTGYLKDFTVKNIFKILGKEVAIVLVVTGYLPLLLSEVESWEGIMRDVTVVDSVDGFNAVL